MKGETEKEFCVAEWQDKPVPQVWYCRTANVYIFYWALFEP